MHRVEIFQANSPAALRDQINLFITKIDAMENAKLQTIQYGGSDNGNYSAMVVYAVVIKK